MRIFATIAVTLGVLLSACASNSQQQVSDHFDGKTYFNPERTRLKSFWEVLKWQLTREKADWPLMLDTKVATELPSIEKDKTAAITFVNHSTFLIQTADYNFLTDPIWSERSSPFTWAGPKRNHPPGLPFDLLPKIHYVMISHNHYDHLDKETLQRIDKKFNPQVLVPVGDKKLVKSFGVEHVHEMDWWDEVQISADVKIVFLRCQHWSARGLFDKNESLWGAYLLIYKNKKIYFAGDTGYSNHFTEAVQKYGPMDLALLPIGAYEPRHFMKDHHMNPKEAVQAHIDLQAKKSIGMHFGTFQLSDEKHEQPKADLEKALRERNVPLEDFITVPVGTTYQLP